MINRWLPLERALGYEFKNKDLLQCALTHCSAGVVNNERYEFLGDSLINFLIAERLYQRFAYATEGELTRLRAMCVRGETLAELAQQFDLGKYLKLGAGEIRSGGAHRPSILADTMEAIIAAIYLDSGMEQVRTCILAWYEPLLATLFLGMEQKDPKTELQEWLQARKKPLPLYTVINVVGNAHQQCFTIRCEIPHAGQVFTAEGQTRRKAEQAAAKQALAHFKR